jgi:hypothetical protein
MANVQHKSREKRSEFIKRKPTQKLAVTSSDASHAGFEYCLELIKAGNVLVYPEFHSSNSLTTVHTPRYSYTLKLSSNHRTSLVNLRNFVFTWSQWPRGLGHETISTAQTLGSRVRIPLEAWMSVRVSSVFVLSCVRSGLATGLITRPRGKLLLSVCKIHSSRLEGLIRRRVRRTSFLVCNQQWEVFLSVLM